MANHKNNFEVYLEDGDSVKFNCREVVGAELKNNNKIISLLLKDKGLERKVDMDAGNFRRAIRYSGSCVAEYSKWEDLLGYVKNYF